VTGQIVSHYRIIEKLGAGGMGVVYKAEDTTLRRTVALKLLPEHALDNRERFLREAQAAAALNHPNICTVFEVDEEHRFLAMELIDGASVKDKIAARPLPLEETLNIALQTCAGLQAAHERGVVHRDIKPANLMVTGKGQVKVMDFGLAQLGDRTRITKTGSSLGTPAYMSPEQAQGNSVDHRTDIWSLGVVLYEMVTGRQPFRGDTEAAVSYGIVHSEPEPLSALRTGVPLELDRIAAKALTKDPGQRYQHVDDLLVDLRKLGPVPSQVRPRRPRRWTEWLVRAGAAICGALAVGAWFLSSDQPSVGAPSVEFSVLPAKGTNFPLPTLGSGGPWPSISPDGRHLAFVALRPNGEQLIWVRPLASSAARPLLETRGAIRPFWSPDSRFIGYFSNGRLWSADLDSGAARALCDAPYYGGSAGAWGDDVILFSSAGGLYRVREGGGPPALVLSDTEDSDLLAPNFLPGGRHFLYLALRRRSGQGGELCAGSLESPKTTCFPQVPAAARYAAPGYLLFAKNQAVVAQPFDSRRLLVSGEPFTVEGVHVSGEPRYLPPQLSTSDDGALTFIPPGAAPLAWLDHSGAVIETVGDGTFPAVSRDGNRMVVQRIDPRTGTSDLWLYDRARGAESRFTFDPSPDTDPVFSPDAEHVLFVSDRIGKYQLFRKPVSGAGSEEVVASGSLAASPDWSPDGRFILYQAYDRRTSWDLWAFSLSGDRKPFVVAQTQGGERVGRFSPNGRFVAYDSTESGRREVWVQSFPPTGSKWQVSTAGGVNPRWRGDGKELFFVSADGMMTAVIVEAGPTFATGAQRKLFQTMFHGGVPARYAVSHDGKRFLMNVPPRLEDLTPITVVFNWTTRLRK
jgi:serine/threonine protein kinase